jgi:serine/threonine-protein phosphatase 2A activator
MGSRHVLERLPSTDEHTFSDPVKKIHDGPDVTFFLTSLAYREITTFILQLNHSVLPRRVTNGDQTDTQTWPLGSDAVKYSDAVEKIRLLIQKLEQLIQDAPPDTGPRRFGNVSFRKWYSLVEQQLAALLGELLPEHLKPAGKELESYLLGSFGSAQRLDYGTGHELSFTAFLACLWKLGYFSDADVENESRGIVLGIFETYLTLVRLLIKTYTLEPAGSHGVWGLDDNSFLPYMFGSAQLCPAISDGDETPIEGSLPSAPSPGDVTKLNLVEKEQDRNMYFSAIAFIYDVKKGPFWEHSPILYDISGIKDGWGKINKGMIKMYNAEVLSKFPVVQHFPFGSLLKWEKDPQAKAPPTTTHSTSQPLRNPMSAPTGASTSAPRTTRPPVGVVNGVTQAPWASRTPAPPPPGVRPGPPRRPGQ